MTTRSVEVTDDWLKKIAEQVEGLSYGDVHITVHDGKIVQIDRTVKNRFELQKATARKYK